MWDTDKQERTLTWARYLYWADLSLRHWDAYVEGARLQGEYEDWWRFFALQSHWYASEYVVIEGWRDAGLHDPVIDHALNGWADVVDMLRRYRNGVFHFQPNLIEARFDPFLQDSQRSMFWAHYLHHEFLRYYWAYVHRFPGTADDRAEWRDTILGIVGWIPEDLIEAKTQRLRDLSARAQGMTEGHSDALTEDLRAAASEGRMIAEQQLSRYRQRSREFLLRKEPK